MLAATAVASEGWQAEVLAKAAFLDAGRGLELIDGLGAAALVMVPDGLLTTSTWAALTDGSGRLGRGVARDRDSQLWWYTARAGGIVAWALLAASVVWGLLLSTRLRPGGVAPRGCSTSTGTSAGSR